MSNKLFDLETRIPITESIVANTDVARQFDLSARTSMRFPMERIANLLEPYCKDDVKILNLGSQTGLLSFLIGGQYSNVQIFGVEENEHMVEIAEENMMFATLARSPARVEFQTGKLDNLAVEDNEADIVLSYLPLHRISNPVKFFQECNRVCKDDGFVFVFDLARDADEGVISFILQYVSEGHDEFMDSMKASYTEAEVADILKQSGLEHWVMKKDSINLVITSKDVF